VCPPTDGEKLQTWISRSGTAEIFIVPFVGHAIMLEAPEIISDVISEFLIKLEEQLSHAWQLAYTAEDKWSLKNKEKVLVHSI
jgi:hypothetical protein